MKTNTVIEAADLFCGAGGTSEGLLRASRDLKMKVNLLAINHWPVAINSHSLNHKEVRHKCENLDSIRPRDAVPGGRLGLLCASPECTHHSVAAGGRPKKDQSRASAWHVCRWAADLHIDAIFMENVREFLDWGPLFPDHNAGCTHEGTEDDPCIKRCHYNKPIPERKGETFKAWLEALKGLDYNVEYKIQCCAHFGDPTSRKRLIIMAVKGRHNPIPWPKATHGPGLKPFRTARSIIDWKLKGRSIFGRKKPLSKNTLRRIAAGLQKFGGPNAKPFLVMLYGTGMASDVDKPLPTVTAGGNHIGVVEPEAFILPHPRTKGGGPKSVDAPLGTITATSSDMQLVQPYLLSLAHGTKKGDTDNRRAHRERKDQDPRTHSLDKPMPTLVGTSAHALVEPFLMHMTHTGADAARCHSPDSPVPTITGAHRGEIAVVEPMVLGQQSCAAARPVDQPLPTIATDGAIALVEPFIVKYYGTGTAKSVELPLDCIPTKDRFALVEAATGKVVAELDIRLRMLQPHELAAAMSFPDHYKFYGSREQQVKQIGNAVPCETAKAHTRALLKAVVV